jgi:transposase
MSRVFNRIGIYGYRVLRIEHQDCLKVHVTPRSRGGERCSCCGGGRLRSKGSYRRQARHLDCLGEPTKLVVHTRRFTCRDCRRTFVPQLPGLLAGRRSTEPFREKVYLHHHEGIPASSMARISRMGAATVGRIYAQFTERKAAERIRLQCPNVLGIDEHTIHNGQRFATTFCDLKNHKVFDIVKGRSEADMLSFLGSLKGRERVRVVCIDLSSPYRAMIKRWFPNARIVADRFHVVRVLLTHFMDLCRQIAPVIKSHRGYLALLRMAPERLEPDQLRRLQILFDQHPALAALHERMHALRRLLNVKNRTKRQCRPLISKLLAAIAELKASGFPPLLTLAQTLASWREEIACMWRFTKNNGITEGFHRKMKLIQRRAYGFRNFQNYRLRVIAQCG